MVEDLKALFAFFVVLLVGVVFSVVIQRVSISCWLKLRSHSGTLEQSLGTAQGTRVFPNKRLTLHPHSRGLVILLTSFSICIIVFSSLFFASKEFQPPPRSAGAMLLIKSSNYSLFLCMCESWNRTSERVGSTVRRSRGRLTACGFCSFLWPQWRPISPLQRTSEKRPRLVLLLRGSVLGEAGPLPLLFQSSEHIAHFVLHSEKQ